MADEGTSARTKVGRDNTKDPVCGSTVRSDTPYKIKMVREDRKYFFCSADCLETFRKEPSRYAA